MNPPLAGIRILVGRAWHQASALSAGLKVLGAEVIEVPFIEIRRPRSYTGLDSALKRIAEYDWLVLTSVNGMDAVAKRMRKLRINASQMQHLRIAAIGPATADAIRAIGLKVAVVPKRYVAESVVAALRSKVARKLVLLARAKVARDVIPRELRKLGARVDVVEAYETLAPQSSRKKVRALMSNFKRRPDVIIFTSSSAVTNFIQLLGRRGHSLHTGIRLASIGPITSATLRENGLHPTIEAQRYTIPGLISAIRKHFNK